MSLVFSIICFSSVFFVLNGQCGSSGSRLKIAIEDSSWSGTNGNILATVLETNGDWTPWRRLDNLNCDDFIPGTIDYFSDFDDIESIDAIQIHNCGTDGVEIETLAYRFNDNTGYTSKYFFCSTATGFVENDCFVQGPIGYSTFCGSNYFSDLYIDGNYGDTSCDTVTIDFTITSAYAKGYIKKLPRQRIDCSILADPTPSPTKEPTPCGNFNGKVGAENSDTPVCCPSTCRNCNTASCSNINALTCCTTWIQGRNQYCDVTGAAPCIIGSPSN